MVAADDAFPPRTWLGYGLDMTSTTPTDITTVTKSVLRILRLITLSTGGEQENFNGVVWTVPDGVDVATDVNTGESSYNSYSDGTSAASSIEADASLSGKYMAVEIDASSNYSISKTFNQAYQYALFSFNQNLLQVGFEDFGTAINDTGIVAHLKTLPDQFDPSSTDVVKKYRSFFKTIGTHVITGASYGGRFQLNAWSSNSGSSQTEDFGTNVSVAFNGLTTSGQFDASVKTSSEYTTFSQSLQKTCSCQGGDSKIAGEIASNPEDTNVYKGFQSWIETARTLPDVMSFQTMALWDLMSASVSPDMYNRAGDIQTAFQWIAENPALHETKCRFVINSDWGEVGLLTPSAFIIQDPDPSNPTPKDNINFATTKITWGKEHSHQFQRDVTIDLIITNDGSPIDIELSHGSDGATGGSGQCAITINGTEYNNQGVKDNNWNSQWFYQCEVNPNEHSPMPKTGAIPQAMLSHGHRHKHH